VQRGTNVLIGGDMNLLRKEVARILDGAGPRRDGIEFWDGRASERIADVILNGQAFASPARLAS
jgi:UDP-N-acetylglucosamine 2-epimerase